MFWWLWKCMFLLFINLDLFSVLSSSAFKPWERSGERCISVQSIYSTGKIEFISLLYVYIYMLFVWNCLSKFSSINLFVNWNRKSMAWSWMKSAQIPVKSCRLCACLQNIYPMKAAGVYCSFVYLFCCCRWLYFKYACSVCFCLCVCGVSFWMRSYMFCIHMWKKCSPLYVF